MSLPTLSVQEFSELQDFVDKSLGIHLSDAKRVMVEQRIRPLVVNAGYNTFHEYITGTLLNKPSNDVMTAFVDRITTNHTYFWREHEHFKLLEEKILPEVTEKLQASGTSASTHSLRMWCCAASRGHEPYTLAMIQRRFFGNRYSKWNAGLLATDISDQALNTAILGRYDASEVKDLPHDFQEKYFTKTTTGELEATRQLKGDVVYRKFNLKNAVYKFRHPFDIIFCRNVLIYFDAPTTADVVRKICTRLTVGGYLFVGLAESLGRDIGTLKYIQPGVYKKVS